MAGRRDPVMSIRMPAKIMDEIERQVNRAVEVRSRKRVSGHRYDQAKPNISSWIREACLQRLARTRTAKKFAHDFRTLEKESGNLRQTYETAVQLLKGEGFLP